jgi:hypothetical protein
MRAASAPSTRPRSGLLGAMAVTAVAAVAIAGCGDDDGAATPTTTTPTTVATTTTTEAPGEVVDAASLQVGDCFDVRVFPGQGATDVEEEAEVRVSCDDPHRNEVYLRTELDIDLGEPYPGSPDLAERADDLCLDAFEDFVGLDYVRSVWEIGYTMPTEATWGLPDRTVTCFVFHRDGDKVRGSAAGSEQ